MQINLNRIKQVFLISVSFLFVFSGGVSLKAQVAGGKHQKLFDLYVMGNYDGCLKKALKMTENDKYKSESEPYLWASMCYYEIMNDPELSEFYPKALRDALKYGVKFKKKDDKLKTKELPYLYDQNEAFINKLKQLAISEGKGFLAQNDYRKAIYYYKLGLGLDPTDDALRLIKGVVDLYNKNTREGQTDVDLALEHFEEMAKGDGYEPIPENEMAFVDGFIYYGDYLLKKGQTDKAIEVAKLAMQLAPQNKKFVRLYKKASGE